MISAILLCSVLVIACIEIERVWGVLGGQKGKIQMFHLEPNVQRYSSSSGQTIAHQTIRDHELRGIFNCAQATNEGSSLIMARRHANMYNKK